MAFKAKTPPSSGPSVQKPMPNPPTLQIVLFLHLGPPKVAFYLPPSRV